MYKIRLRTDAVCFIMPDELYTLKEAAYRARLYKKKNKKAKFCVITGDSIILSEQYIEESLD